MQLYAKNLKTTMQSDLIRKCINVGEYMPTEICGIICTDSIKSCNYLIQYDIHINCQIKINIHSE